MTDEEMQVAVAEIYIRPGQGTRGAMDAMVALARKLPGVLEVYIITTAQHDAFTWEVFIELNDDWVDSSQVEHTMRLATRLMAHGMNKVNSFAHLAGHYKRARVVRAWGLIDPLAPPADAETTP